jgi:hypothetical protein
MGFSGRIVVARADKPLSELGILEGEVLEEETLRDGFRSVTLGGSPGRPEAVLKALVGHTAAPAIWAFVMDSDMADVSALTPQGVQWKTYLHEEAALEFGAPPLEHPVEEIARRAAAWSEEAGLTSSPDAITGALTADNVFVEETFSELLSALGL